MQFPWSRGNAVTSKLFFAELKRRNVYKVRSYAGPVRAQKESEYQGEGSTEYEN
jgi:hypothetical protein